MPGMVQPERTIVWEHEDPTQEGANVTIKSPISGRVNTARVAMSRQQYDAWQAGQYIQTAMGHLSLDTREFLMSGITPDEWKAAFGDEDATEGNEQGE